MKRAILLTAAISATLALSACGASSDPTSTAGGGSTASSGSGAIVVGSANYEESVVLAAVYAQALKDKGVTVTMKNNIGARDVYIKALQDGSIDVIPEFTGALLSKLAGSNPNKDADSTYSALQKALPADLTVLEKSAATSKDTVTITKANADKWGAKAIGDLVAHQSEITFGGFSEFATKEPGLTTLKNDYNFVPKGFQPFSSSTALAAALKNGQVQAADIFTSSSDQDPATFVVLDDPKGSFGSQNVVPLLNKSKVNPTVTAALNAVSTKLTTDALVSMTKAYTVDHKDPSAVATDFLKSVGLS